MRILENSLFKIIAIVAIIYFGLFANKQSPESLGNRLSTEKIKKNLGEAQEKSKFIITNVRAAQDYSVNGEKGSLENNINISYQDITLGTGKDQVLCGTQVSVVVSLSSEKGAKFITNQEMSFIVGSNFNELIEPHIYNMKKGGVREIKIPRDYVVKSPEIAKILRESDSDLKYSITLKTINQATLATNLDCK